MHQDALRYTEPDKFLPERFISYHKSAAAYANSSDVAARDHFNYGGGKRICPGLHLGKQSLLDFAFTVCSMRRYTSVWTPILLRH
jgi:cytochrome P450 family 619